MTWLGWLELVGWLVVSALCLCAPMWVVEWAFDRWTDPRLDELDDW